jgi:hypothetical protein
MILVAAVAFVVGGGGARRHVFKANSRQEHVGQIANATERQHGIEFCASVVFHLGKLRDRVVDGVLDVDTSLFLQWLLQLICGELVLHQSSQKFVEQLFVHELLWVEVGDLESLEPSEDFGFLELIHGGQMVGRVCAKKKLLELFESDGE